VGWTIAAVTLAVFILALCRIFAESEFLPCVFVVAAFCMLSFVRAWQIGRDRRR
jgi:hypothetical protein